MKKLLIIFLILALITICLGQTSKQNQVLISQKITPVSNCDPTSFTGATIWIDGTSASLPGLADGGAVGSTTNWIEQITGTRNFSQGTAANRPILHTSGGSNNKPYVQFADDTDNVVYSTTISNVISASAYTI